MTETNINELKELADLREWVKELEDAILKSLIGTKYFESFCGIGAVCRHCDEPICNDHNPDCIVTKIKQRRGE